jgi:hypothetical protein
LHPFPPIHPDRYGTHPRTSAGPPYRMMSHIFRACRLTMKVNFVMMSENMSNQPQVSQPLALFRTALLHGWLHKLWARLTRRCFYLEELGETPENACIQSSHYGGVKSIPIDRIPATEGRAEDFDAEFNPIQERTRARWLEIALQKLRGRDLPPVELVELVGIYYVRDGHHRISVSHSLGQQYMDAEVTVMQVRQRMTLEGRGSR